MTKNAFVPRRRPWVQAVRVGEKTYLYYRREDRRQALPGPEGSTAFLRAYDQLHAEFEGRAEAWARHTVGAAVSAYKGSADYRNLARSTTRRYLQYLDEIMSVAGHLAIVVIDVGWANA